MTILTERARQFGSIKSVNKLNGIVRSTTKKTEVLIQIYKDIRKYVQPFFTGGPMCYAANSFAPSALQRM